MAFARWTPFTTLLVLGACASPASPPVVDVPPPASAIPIASAPSDDRTPLAFVDAGPPPAEASLGERLLRQWGAKSGGAHFDYGAEGGIQTFWDHRPSTLTVAQVASWAGVDIFVSGPHSKTELELGSGDDFGHYNPAFVKWLVDKSRPSARDSNARKATQLAYDQRLKPLAEIFYYTLGKARADRECFEKEKNSYASLIARKKLPAEYYERWFYFMNPGYCDRIKRGLPMASDGPTSAFNLFNDNGFDAGVDGNVTKSVIGFWLRRSIDGTMDSFADGLHELLEAYEPDLLAHAYRPPDLHAIEAFLTKGVAKAQSCHGTQRHVQIRFDPSGSVLTSPRTTCAKTAFEGTIPAFDGGALLYRRDLGAH